MRGSKRRGEGHSNSDGSWSYWFLMLKTWVLRLWGEDEVVNLFIWALKRIWCWTVLKLYNLAISQSSYPLPDLFLLHLPSPLSQQTTTIQHIIVVTPDIFMLERQENTIVDKRKLIFNQDSIFFVFTGWDTVMGFILKQQPRYSDSNLS